MLSAGAVPGIRAGTERAPEPDGLHDWRIREVTYASDEIYRLKGFVGFQIDIEFERGESFVGLGTGDIEGLAFASQENHLFLKPRAAGGATNLTVLTTRRAYHFDYTVSDHRPDPAFGDVIYVLRFLYAPAPSATPAPADGSLERAAATRPRNPDYGYCGSPDLKPEAAWDDGVQTHVRFGARQELPAIFVHNDDGSESLVNFNVSGGDLVVHRIARQFIVRRGRLAGCIVNRAYSGTGERLESGTVAPSVQRVTIGTQP